MIYMFFILESYWPCLGINSRLSLSLLESNHNIEEVEFGEQGMCHATLSCSLITLKFMYWLNYENNLLTENTSQKKDACGFCTSHSPAVFFFVVHNTENAFDYSFNVHCLGFNGQSELRTLKPMQVWPVYTWNCIHDKLYAELIPAHIVAL